MNTTLATETRQRAVEVAWTPPVTAPIPSGAAVAAILSAGLGLLALALVSLATQASEAASAWVHGIGRLWMPAAEGIGPYSGKETLALAAWVGSWIVLHLTLRRRDAHLARWLVVFLLVVGLATTLLWPPVFEYLAGH